MSFADLARIARIRPLSAWPRELSLLDARGCRRRRGAIGMSAAAFLDPPEAVINQGEAASGIGLALGEDPRAIVHVTLHLRRNHEHGPDAEYVAHLAADPDLAQELGRYLIAAAKAARKDLAAYLSRPG
jgi:hypothetical protein